MSHTPPAVDRDDGSMGSGKYFPIPALPTFGSSELGASFQALASHPKYRAVLQPYGDVHFDRYKKSLDLLRSWERIAERYTAIDVEDDLEIDVVTGDTIHRGETIHLDEEEKLELWGDDYTDEEDDEDDMLDDSKACQSGDAVLNKLERNAFQEGDDDWDVLDFWGPESEMQTQAEALPDISSFPVKAASKKDQAELAAFLRHEDGRKRLEQLDSGQSVPAIDSDDHVEYAVDAYSDKRNAPSIVIRDNNGVAMLVPHPDESPKKKRKVGRPRLIRASHTEQPHVIPGAAFLAAAVVDSSSDDVDLCSDALVVTNDLFRTPKPSRASGTRARRGRRPNIALLTPRKTESSRESRPEKFSAEWIDQNLLRSEITTPYISRSSRVVKVPERWGAHIQWASIRRKRNKKPTSDIEAKRAPLECYVDLPAVPLDWREYTRSFGTIESAVSLIALAASSAPEERDGGSSVRPVEELAESTCSSRASSPIEPVIDADRATPPASDGPLDGPVARSSSCLDSPVPSEAITLFVQADDAICSDVIEVLAKPSTICRPESDEDGKDDLAEVILLSNDQELSLDLDSRNSSPLSSPSLSPPPDEEDNRLARIPSSPLSSAPALSDDGDAQEGPVDPQYANSASEPAADCGDEILHEAGSDSAVIELPFDYEDLPSVQDEPALEAEASDTASDFEDTIYVRPWSRPAEREQVLAPLSPPVDWHPVKYELLPDDDPLCQNTMDGELDDLNWELSLNRRVMLPVSVRLPQGAKGSAIEHPITIDDEEDELGGWDLDGWS